VDTHAEDVSGKDATTSKSRFEVLTARGAVRHLGTQYMVRMEDQRLLVGVRSGSVQVLAGKSANTTPLFVANGHELLIEQAGDHELQPLKAYGSDWLWAENLGPGFVLDGRTLTEFLEWVAGETGLTLTYQTSMAKSVADDTVLHGKVDLPAKEALDLVLLTSDLSAEIRDGSIEIRLKSGNAYQ
jgi:hypothetical protein